REARAAAGINHPNVVTIHAVEEKIPYLVMEYVPGRTLRDRIRLTSSLDLTSSLRIGAQIAAGLAAAHQHGVIPRDVNPADHMPPALHEVNPETPRFLSEIVTRLLAKNPVERFQTADEVSALLLQHLAALNQGGSDGLANTVPFSLPPRRRRKPLVTALLLA